MKSSLLTLLLVFYLGCPITVLSQIKEKGVKKVEPCPTRGNIFSVIIGISKYNYLPRLNYADKDALNFYKHLRTIYPDVDSSNFGLFTNFEANAASVNAMLYEINQKSKSGDKIYIYFSGHGDVEQELGSEQCLLLLSNMPEKNYLRYPGEYLAYATSFGEFIPAWNAKKIETILICDACHSGKLAGGETGRINAIESLKKTWGNNVKILSCQSDELSLEGSEWGNGRGLFSYYLGMGMLGLADKNNDMNISLFELQKYIQDSVSKKSSQKQIPFAVGNLNAEMSHVSADIVANATKQIHLDYLSSSKYENSIAIRGQLGNYPVPENRYEDSIVPLLYINFMRCIMTDKLIEPENDCAKRYYTIFPEYSKYYYIKSRMRFKLFYALENSFELILKAFYSDNFNNMPGDLKYKIQQNLSVCLDLAGDIAFLRKSINSKLLFMEACEKCIDCRPGIVSWYNIEKMKEGLDLLDEGISISSISPHLYLCKADYLLYTNQVDSAIVNYQIFQKMLPNYEISWNRLGMAYTAEKSMMKR